MGHYVYKYVLNKEIIYIGKTDAELKTRLSNHGKPGDNINELAWEDINNADIYYAELANEMMTDVVESELICKYKPKYNVAKKTNWEGLNFVEPIWYYYGNSEGCLEELKNLVEKQSDAIKIQVEIINKLWNQYNNLVEMSKSCLLDFSKLTENDSELNKLLNECSKLSIIDRCKEKKIKLKKRIGKSKGGRPPKFSDQDIQYALGLLNVMSYSQVSQITGISKTTLIRHRNKTSNKCV